MRNGVTLLLGVALAAGCAPAFTYRPAGPVAGVKPLEARVAVLPFENGTEDFVERMGPGTEKKWNLARKGLIGMMGALPPIFWSRSL